MKIRLLFFTLLRSILGVCDFFLSDESNLIYIKHCLGSFKPYNGDERIQLELGLITLTRLNLINCKIFTILHNPYYNLFAYSSCTSLFILLFIKSTNCIAHFTQFFLLILFLLPIFILLCCVTYFSLSIERTWPDLYFTTDHILYNWVCDK